MASCYYPNGNPSPGDIPCNTSGGDGPCCPNGWQCESNGLCFLQNAGYYGRYTCTDKTWDSSSCPQICTYDKTASGDEAILQCTSGEYCCDTNRPELSGGTPCCQASNNRFSLAALPILAGGGAASMGSSPTGSTPSSTTAPNSAPSSNTPAHGAQSSPTSTSTSNTSPTQASSSPTVEVLTSIVTEGGTPSTLVTSTSSNVAVPAKSTSIPATSSSSSKSLASIVGPAVGVPVAVLALVALVFFLLWRRRRNSRRPPPQNLPERKEEPTPMYGEPKPPVETIPYAGKSELEGSPHVGHPSPNPSTAPPSYRGVSGQQRPLSELPGSPTAATFRDSRGSEMAAMGINTSPRQSDLPTVGEAGEGAQQPSELPASTYHPYRP